MNLYTYHENIGDADQILNSQRLIDVWWKHHYAHGFAPFILGVEDAKRHPFFEEFNAAVSKFPSTVFEGFDLACFRRWLAMAKVGGGLMADYDLFIYNGFAKSWLKRDDGRITLFDKRPSPGLVFGSSQAYLDQCHEFARYAPQPDDQYKGKPHVSDQTIIRRQIARDPSSIRRLNRTAHYNDPGWKDFPVVHYGAGGMVRWGMFPERWKFIPSLRKD